MPRKGSRMLCLVVECPDGELPTMVLECRCTSRPISLSSFGVEDRGTCTEVYSCPLCQTVVRISGSKSLVRSGEGVA